MKKSLYLLFSLWLWTTICNSYAMIVPSYNETYRANSANNSSDIITCYSAKKNIYNSDDFDSLDTQQETCKSDDYFCTIRVKFTSQGKLFYYSSCLHHVVCSEYRVSFLGWTTKVVVFSCCPTDLCNSFANLSAKQKLALNTTLNSVKKNVTTLDCYSDNKEINNSNDFYKNPYIDKCNAKTDVCDYMVIKPSGNKQPLVQISSCMHKKDCNKTNQDMQKFINAKLNYNAIFITHKCCEQPLCNTFGNLTNKQQNYVTTIFNAKHNNTSFIMTTNNRPTTYSLTTILSNNTNIPTKTSTTNKAILSNTSNSILLLFVISRYLYSLFF